MQGRSYRLHFPPTQKFTFFILPIYRYRDRIEYKDLKKVPTGQIRAAVCLIFILLLNILPARGDQSEKEKPGTTLSFSLAPVYQTVSWPDRSKPLLFEEKESTTSGPEPKMEKKTGRAILEYFSVIAIPQIFYWAGWWGEYKPWHYRLNWKDQSKKLFTLSAWKFDSNIFFVNWMHASAGAVYYNIARSNRLNRFESLLFTLGGSFYWEYVAEWRTVVSINDNIFTILGGFPIGEAWYNLGRFFLFRSGALNGFLSFLNPVLKFNSWLDRKTGSLISQDQEPGWHDFRLALGLWSGPISKQKWTGKNMFVHVDAQLLSQPDAEKPGDVGQKVGTTLFSGIFLDILSSRGLVDEVSFSFRSVYLGYFRKSLDSNLNGYRYYLGLGSAFSYFKQRAVAFYDSGRIRVKDIHLLNLEEPRNFRDKFAAVHVVGPVFDLTVRRGRFQARLMAEAYADFSMVNALALNEYSTVHDIRGAKTTLVYYGYYYGLGGSLSLRLDVDYGPLEFRGRFIAHDWGSIEGHDNFQSEVRDDFHITDSRASLYLSAGFRFGSSPFVFTLGYAEVGRRGILKDIKQTEHESRLLVGFVLRY